MMSKLLAAGLMAVAAGCVGFDSEDATRTQVAANELGVVALETTQTGSMFELRALDGSDAQRGRVTLEKTAQESRITIMIDDQQLVVRTLERELFRIAATSNDRVRAFLALNEVSATLAREAHIQVVQPPPPATEQPYFTETCPSAYLNAWPLAKQCCYTEWGTNYTMFVNGNNELVTRYHNPYGTGCRASDGLSSCNGSACYYGPNGFSRASMEYYFGYIPQVASEEGSYCYNAGWSYFDPYHYFGDVWGDYPTGGGCPGSGTGDGEWDY